MLHSIQSMTQRQMTNRPQEAIQELSEGTQMVLQSGPLPARKSTFAGEQQDSAHQCTDYYHSAHECVAA